jgi:hypothetical protein
MNNNDERDYSEEAFNARILATGDGEDVLRTPRGYVGVEHDGGTVHAVSWDDQPGSVPLWRTVPVCGTSTGVSSDEGGRAALYRHEITCRDCIGILA